MVATQTPSEFETYAKAVGRHQRVITFPAGGHRFASTIEDITERRQAEIAMQEERYRAQGYLSIAGVMIVALDADQKVTLINAKGCEFLGCSEEEIVGVNWFDTFIPAGIRDAVKAAYVRSWLGIFSPSSTSKTRS